jgi:putative transposase
LAKPPRDRASAGSDTYFLTATTWQNRSLFQSEGLAELFLVVLYEYRRQGKYLLHEFVLMPNHSHLLLTLIPPTTVARAMQFIKGGFSHRAGQEPSRNLEIWQRGYIDHRIRDAADYAQHREYIHRNPVRAALVTSPEEYRYSSARGGFELDPPPQGLKPI